MLNKLKIAQERLEAERLERLRKWKAQMAALELRRKAGMAESKRISAEAVAKTKA